MMQEEVSSERLLINFSLTDSHFEAGKEWRVASDTDAVLALILLTGSEKRPSTLAIYFFKEWCNLRNKALLSVAAEQCKSVSLKYLSSFWTPDTESTKEVKTALETFLISNQR